MRDATAPAVSVDEAAAALGVSPNTIRRWLKAGALRGERVERPQGVLWRVYLPSTAPPTGGLAGAEDLPRGTSQAPPAAPDGTSRQVLAGTSQAPAEVLAALMADYTNKMLAPLVAELERLQRENRDQAERLGALAKDNEHLAAELAAAQEHAQAQQVPAVTPPAAPAGRRWWAWWRR